MSPLSRSYLKDLVSFWPSQNWLLIDIPHTCAIYGQIKTKNISRLGIFEKAELKIPISLNVYGP